MKLTAQAEYGLRCILAVARAQLDQRPEPGTQAPQTVSLTVNEIAKREGLSLEYAGKLIRILRRAICHDLR